MKDIVVRDVKTSDIDWIEKLLIEGTRLKHFSPTVGSQAHSMLVEAITKKRVEFLMLRNGKKEQYFRGIKIYVAELNGTPASFQICAEDKDAMELHLAGTKKEYRRQGCFRQLVEHALVEHKNTQTIYARCYKKSTWALDGLKKCNFVITREGDTVELTLQ